MSPTKSVTKPLIALAALLSLSTPALADPTVGLGLSFSFGGGKPQTGVGLRVFSDNERDSFVGSVGVDYMFGIVGFPVQPIARGAEGRHQILWLPQ